MAFCPNCGVPLEEGAKFCTSCGTSVAPAPADQSAPTQPQPQPAQPASQPAQPQPQPAPQQPTSPAGKNYETLGGWLLFFVICNGISAVIGLFSLMGPTGLVGTMLTVRGGLSFPVLGSVLTNLLSVASDVLFVVLILKKQPNFLRLIQLARIAVIVASALLMIVIGLSYKGAAAMYTTKGVTTLITGGIGLILMTLYFCKSERVRVYMGTTDYLDTALFKIGV